MTASPLSGCHTHTQPPSPNEKQHSLTQELIVWLVIYQQYNTILPLNILHSPEVGIFIQMRILHRTVNCVMLLASTQGA